MSPRRTDLVLLIFLAVSVVGCDQLTKDIARNSLEPHVSHIYAGGVVELLLVENPGGLLSLGERLPESVRLLLFRAFVPLALLLFVFHLWRSSTRATVIGTALILGGGIGNWLDRLSADAAVTDFLRLGLGPVQTGIFNVADVALMAGVAVLLLFPSADPKEPEAAPPDELPL